MMSVGIRQGSPLRRGWLGLLLIALALASAIAKASPVSAEDAWRGADAYDEGRPRVEAELLIDAAEVRPGQRVRVGVRFAMDPGWHLYWRNAGASGLPTKLSWDVRQAEVGPIQWPVPEVFRESDGFLTTYGYAESVLLASDAVVAEDAAGRLRFAVVADFVTCEIGCIPGRIALAREIDVTRAGRPPSLAVRASFERAAQRLPRRPEDLGVVVGVDWSQRAIRPGDRFQAALSLFSCATGDFETCSPRTLGATRADEAFLPELLPGISLSIDGLAREPAGPKAITLVISGEASQEDPAVDLQRLRGLVPLRDASGQVVHVEVDVPLPRAAAGEQVASFPLGVFEVGDSLDAADEADRVVRAGDARPSELSLWSALGLGLLGGLILNLMPCVLPILALKVFAIADLAHESRRRVVAHGAAYTAGVLLSMAALAGVVTLLRVAGTSVGWGFQFQEPMFIAAISTVLVVFAMNLFGVFEVTVQPQGPQVAMSIGSSLPRRSFLEGGLAVVLATPCTAPFLGTAVGFAFASGGVVIFVIFLAIGLGLAAPYALVTLVPGWARWVPRPGPWMLALRRVLGFALLATVVWLLWVAGRAVGIDAQAALLAFLVTTAFLTWIYGGVQTSSRLWLSRSVAVLTLLVIGWGLGALPLEPLTGSTLVASGGAPLDAVGDEHPERQQEEAWRPYDLAAIEQERAQGRPVLVDFTADWCITCKVNERVVLSSDSVRSELERLNVATFKADWTLYDEEIRLVLAAHGRAGVPMYLVYSPGPNATPKLLPELLTIDLTIRALRAAATGGRLTSNSQGVEEPSI